MMSPGQFYPLPTQTSVTLTLNNESQNEMAGIPSYQASSIPLNSQNHQSSTRDIKIRKLNPAAHSKASKRFTLAGPQGVQQPQSMSITGQNPLNYLQREIASQPSTMVKANSRRNIEYHNTLAEASAPQV